MPKLLLIVDPQIDFISGSLPVPGAAEAMAALASYIKDSDGRYAAKIVTADRHPYGHCSFTDCGGTWPRHCVESSPGAAILPELFDPLFTTAGDVTLLYKGEEANREQYSIFANPEAAEAIRRIVCENGIDTIDLCGLAGDVCVRSTLLDGLKLLPSCRFNVLEEFSPSIDGGTKLHETIENLSLCNG